MEIRVLAIKFEGFVPYQTVRPEVRGPVVLDKGALAFVIEQTEGMDLREA